MTTDIRAKIRAKVLALASQCGFANARLDDDDIIPKTGLLDSAATVELILWIEKNSRHPLEDDEMTVDNFGSVNRIAAYMDARSHEAREPEAAH
jgi:acyl carrier protein